MISYLATVQSLQAMSLSQYSHFRGSSPKTQGYQVGGFWHADEATERVAFCQLRKFAVGYGNLASCLGGAMWVEEHDTEIAEFYLNCCKIICATYAVVRAQTSSPAHCLRKCK